MIIKEDAYIRINNRRKYTKCIIETLDGMIRNIEIKENPFDKRTVHFLMKISVPSEVKFRVVTRDKVYTGKGIFTLKNMQCIVDEYYFEFNISQFKYVNCRERTDPKMGFSFKKEIDKLRQSMYNDMTREMDRRILESFRS